MSLFPPEEEKSPNIYSFPPEYFNLADPLKKRVSEDKNL